jgi:hypothetical protein
VKNARNWVALPAIAVLLIAQTTVARAATGDTVQTTGGGWIEPVIVLPPPPPPTDPPAEAAALFPAASTANTKANFGFVASGTVQADGTCGDCQGELTYHDHGVGLRLHSLSIDHVWVIDPQTIAFDGTAEVTTADGTVPADFVVQVHDGGEPGKGVDSFDIQLTNFTLPGESSTYHRRGLLGGGNIQTRP